MNRKEKIIARFLRPKSGFFWPLAILGCFYGLSSIRNLINGYFLRGSIEFLMVLIPIHLYFWEQKIPIITITNSEVKIWKNSIKKPKRIPISSIREICEPSPPKIQIIQKNNRKIIIQKHWLIWEDRKRFFDLLGRVLEQKGA